MTWADYHSGGEDPSRVDLVYDGTVLNQIDLDNVAEDVIPTAAGINFQARLQDERFLQDVELRKRIDGIKQPQKGGFYYQAKVSCPLLDKTSGGKVNSIINHCATPGNYYVHFYPHLDNTALYFVAFIDGQVKPFEKGDRAYYFGHTAELTVYGLEPFPQVPWTETRLMQVLQTGGVYAPGDLVHTQIAQTAGGYSATELDEDIGQVLKENKVYNLVD